MSQGGACWQLSPAWAGRIIAQLVGGWPEVTSVQITSLSLVHDPGNKQSWHGGCNTFESHFPLLFGGNGSEGRDMTGSTSLDAAPLGHHMSVWWLQKGEASSLQA